MLESTEIHTHVIPDVDTNSQNIDKYPFIVDIFAWLTTSNVAEIGLLLRLR